LAAVRTLGRLPPTTVYVWGGHDDAMVAAFAAIDVAIVHLDETDAAGALQFEARFDWLRDRLARDGIGTLLWMCLPIWQSYAFALRLAPRQVWWSVKYHPGAVVEAGADVLLSLHGRASDAARWNGHEWRTLPYLVRDPVPAPRPEEAARLREEFPCGCLFFTPSRPEKLTDPIFLDTIVKILRASGDSIWAYPGRADHRAIRDHFARVGLDGRARWIGWVDTGLWAQVADVVLDSFPHSTGLTGVQAMGAAKPLVFLLMPEDHGALGLFDLVLGEAAIRGRGDPQEVAHVRAIFAGGLLMAANSTREYVTLAAQLASDHSLRSASGAAYRTYATDILAEDTQLGCRLADAVGLPATASLGRLSIAR
jgi:hypothetical protein